MNPRSFDSITIPLRDDPKHAHLAKRCENAKPLGMFRSTEEEFMLCYDGTCLTSWCLRTRLMKYLEFGLYVDKHGEPCRSFGLIEWEGTAERVAFHAPYIVLFDSRFIEVRHVETGRLAQIIPGNEIRCTWDGRGVSRPPQTIDSGEDEALEAQVHFVMNSTDSTTGRTKNIVQHVCELVPTVPLYPKSTPATSPAAASMQSPQSMQSMQSLNSTYNPYAPQAQTHLPTNSYASSSSSTYMYSPPPPSQQGGYAPSLPQGAYAPPLPQGAYAPAPAPGHPHAGPTVQGSSSYYGRGYYDTSPVSTGSMPRR